MRYPTRTSSGAGPATAGAVCAQYVVRHGKKFGPYWFRFFREGGKLRKRYVPRAKLDEARRGCEAARVERKARAARGREVRDIGHLVTELDACLQIIHKIEGGHPVTDSEIRRVKEFGGKVRAL